MDPLPVAPLIVIPATGLAVQGITRPTPDRVEPAVLIQLTNAVATTQMPLDLGQARKLVDDVGRAILEAQHAASGLHVASQVPARERANGERRL